MNRMLGRALRHYRTEFILITAVALVVLILSAAMAVAFRGEVQGPTKSAGGDHWTDGKPPPSLGIDLIHCPKAEPEELPPYALADATEAVLDQAPSVFGHVAAYVDEKAQTSEGAYAFSAQLTEGGSASRPGIILDMCHERPQYGQRLLDRSVEVNMIFPEVERESASLSQHTVYVAKFEGDYWVYAIGH